MREAEHKRNKGQYAVKIIAGILAGIFILVSAGTVIFYLFS